MASGVYRNLFREWNPAITDAEIQAKLDIYWNSLLGADTARRVYFPAGTNQNGALAYLVDITTTTFAPTLLLASVLSP